MSTDSGDRISHSNSKNLRYRHSERSLLHSLAATDAFAIRYANLVDLSIFLSERDVLAYSGYLHRAKDMYLSFISHRTNVFFHQLIVAE